jgi:hypothetical protein
MIGRIFERPLKWRDESLVNAANPSRRRNASLIQETPIPRAFCVSGKRSETVVIWPALTTSAHLPARSTP